MDASAEQFVEGNSATYSISTVAERPDSPLRGMRIAFLGSSVTVGEGAMGTSFVDYLQRADGIIATKEAVSGTTLTDIDAQSYVRRLVRNLAMDSEFDALVCQLSTNDATQDLPLGDISADTAPERFDVRTICGAMEFIIAYARQTWRCPVIFYTGTHYDSPAYGAMVDKLLILQQKWGIGVADLWNDAALNRITDRQRALYMNDDVHPTKAGYLQWWTPAIRACLIANLC